MLPNDGPRGRIQRVSGTPGDPRACPTCEGAKRDKRDGGEREKAKKEVLTPSGARADLGSPRTACSLPPHLRRRHHEPAVRRAGRRRTRARVPATGGGSRGRAGGRRSRSSATKRFRELLTTRSAAFALPTHARWSACWTRTSSGCDRDFALAVAVYNHYARDWRAVSGPRFARQGLWTRCAIWCSRDPFSWTSSAAIILRRWTKTTGRSSIPGPATGGPWGTRRRPRVGGGGGGGGDRARRRPWLTEKKTSSSSSSARSDLGRDSARARTFASSPFDADCGAFPRDAADLRDVRLEKSHVLLCGPTGSPRRCSPRRWPTWCACPSRPRTRRR